LKSAFLDILNPYGQKFEFGSTLAKNAILLYSSRTGGRGSKLPNYGISMSHLKVSISWHFNPLWAKMDASRHKWQKTSLYCDIISFANQKRR